MRVAAANQFYHLGIAGALSIGGTAGVAVPVGVRVVNLDTYAYIGTGAVVNAETTSPSSPTRKTPIVSVVAGAGGGTVGVAGTVSP